MADLMEYVRVMADQIGPRPVSTEEEHQASVYIAQELTDDGLEVAVDEFATPTGTRWPYAIAFLLTIVGTLVSGIGIFVSGVSLTMFVLGIVLIAAGFFIYYTEHNNRPVLSKMRAGGVSQNVVARYVPSSVRREQRRRKVIVVAHVDTVRAELEAAPALIKRTALLRRIVYYTMIAVAALTVIRLLPLPWPRVVDTVLWGISLVGCLYLLAACVCIVARRFTPYVSGGNDNASSGAVLLGVARRLLDPEERARSAARRKAEAEAREAQLAAEREAARAQALEQEAAQNLTPVDFAAPGVSESPEAPGAEGETQAFSPLEPPAGAAQPIVHDAEAAYAAGVVPEGAEIEYEAVATVSEQTTAIPPIDAAIPETVPPATGAEEAAEPTTVIPAPVYPEIVEDPAATGTIAAPPAVTSTAGAQGQAAEPAPAAAQKNGGYQPLPDTLFAQTPEESVQGQVAPATPAAQATQPTAVPATATPASAQEAAPASPEPGSGAAPQAPAQAPAEPRPEEKPQKESEKESDRKVPSWYKAAKEKAARDLEARASGDDGKEPDADPESYRSRYAQIPVTGSMANVRKAMEREEAPAEEEPKSEGTAAALPEQSTATEESQAAQVAAAGQQVPADTQAAEVAAQPTQAEPVQAGAASDSQEGASRQETQHIDFGFLDDEIDDISPDMSGVFEAIDADIMPTVKNPAEIADAPQQKAPEQETLRGQAAPNPTASEPEAGAVAEAAPEAQQEKKPGILKGLTSRIPIIGSGDEAHSAGLAASGDVEVQTRSQQPKPKPERRKPTARHITQEFQPTKPVGERDRGTGRLGALRQQAAVSSTYEDTPQAGPERDPFAPRDEQPAESYDDVQMPSRPFPSLSGQGQQGDAGAFGNPGNSASFPSLSGSFPSLSGRMPQVNPNDFGDAYDVDYGYEPSSEDVAEDFGNPNLTGEINMPDSRFHNAIDKVGGLFGHKDKDGKSKKRSRRGKRAKQQDEGYDNFDDGNVDNWDEDDDFGWKGGAYVPGDYDYGYGNDGADSRSRQGSALEAAKARAAEIRDSVIEMTENDLLDKEVWFVALGASGAGNQGMKNFLEIHGPELRGSLIINLEAVGAGTIHYVDTEGTGKSRKSDRRLQSLVRKSSKTLDGVEMRPQKLEWRNTDATPAMAAGLRAMTIMGFDGPAPVAWHWSDDTSDIVNPDNLEYVTELILDMIENS